MHDPNAIPKQLQLNDSASGPELQDQDGVHVGRLPARLLDGDTRTDKYPQGVIRTTEAMNKIGELIVDRYNAGAGQVFPKSALLFTVHFGEASSEEFKFGLMTTMSGNPIVECKETGKKFALSWQNILELAVAAGVTEADDE